MTTLTSDNKTTPALSTAASPVALPAPVRLTSMDAYRGFVMFLMMAEVLSFIPTLGTMILGLIAGGVMRSERAPWAKVKWLASAGVIGLGAGAACGWLGLCPVVKRIWTPSWVLYSGGWCFLLLAAFYLVIDIWGRRLWAFPLVVIGMNSIAAYCMAHLFDSFISSSLNTHLGADIFKAFGQAHQPLIHGALVLFVMWLLLFWMCRRKLFLRI